jgi:hypothetical protein
VNYLEFLIQWYNWPYLAALVAAAGARIVPGRFVRLGSALCGLLGLEQVAAHSIASVFGLVLAVAGLTINGAMHDYWPDALGAGFLPAFALSLIVAAAGTRMVGKVLERHFPEIRAVGFGATDLAGHEGRVVSRSVGPEYRAGRAQVMKSDGTLHMVLCKTRGEEIPYGARVVLEDYDTDDGRYYVEPVGRWARRAGAPVDGPDEVVSED